MKKTLLGLLVSVFLITGCKKSMGPGEENLAPEETLTFTGLRECATEEVLQLRMAEDPSLRSRMEQIEAFTQEYQRNPEAFRVLADGTLEIPVQVNVLYKTTAENVSNAQIQSQIDVLNQDFAGTNSDYNETPGMFQGVRSGDIKIRFIWNSSTGVARKSTKKKFWSSNDDMKRASRGGIDAKSPATTLNIWVCNLGSSLLGYAYYPGTAPLSVDGVVIHCNAFGKGSYPLYSVYNQGRTATHEVGHYFNLKHIWGESTCGNDLVADTPQHNTSNGGCPTFPHYSTCTGTPVEMTMNYMDYTYDDCMYMFTQGQAVRMQATYAVGGPRASLRP